MRTLLRAFGVLALVAGAFLAWALWPEGPGFDPAPLLARAERYDVRIVRDDFGVPHIQGATDPDVAYGLAYAHAEDDALTIQKVLLATRGRLASVDGPDAAPIDYLVQLLGFWDDVQAGYHSEISPEARALAEAYADGFNHWAALHPDAVLPGVVPVRGQDIVAGFAFKTPLFYGLDASLRELFSRGADEDAPKLALQLSPGERAFRLGPAAPPALGSNAVAVSPRRTSDGATRLLVNSHQPYAGPVAWYEVRLESGEGWDAAGGVFPGSPLMLHGHNRDLGWASTVNRPDLVDVYALVTSPERPGQYRLGESWLDLDRRSARLDVRLLGRLRWTFQRDVLRSEHGPVVETPAGSFAFRYAGMGEIRQIDQYYRMNRARDFDAWWSAMSMQALPSINFVYADRTGRIAYVYNASLPRRAPGPDWSGDLPGDRPELIWTEHLSLDELPHVIDPPSGFVVNCNHTPFRATARGEGPRAEDFPERLGIETGMTNRGLRALELWGGDEHITPEEFRSYKYDKRYSEHSAMRDVVAAMLALDVSDDPGLVEAQRVLASWGFGTEIDDRAAALAVLSARPILEARRRGRPEPDLRASLAAAADVLRAHHGRLDPPWGDVNRFRRGRFDEPIGGGPDVLRAAEADALGPDGTFTAESGDTLIMFVEWDAEGRVHSETIHQFGSATLDATSPHFDDQVPLFLAERTKPVRLDEADLRAHLEREYRPGGAPGDLEDETAP
ncbi:MAG TPA: penicillin acylase family protein [Myxococcota bacterium]|nr:penicillin acylase family protein [Myxococcota bacterium]